MSESYRLPRWLRAALAHRLARPARAGIPGQRRRVCIYKVDRLGDFALATGAIRQLVEQFTAGECRLIVSSDCVALAAEQFPDVARWIAPANVSGVWRELRPLRQRVATEWSSETFDHVVCLRHQRSLYRDVSLRWLHGQTYHALEAPLRVHQIALGNRPVLPMNYPRIAELPWSRELLAHRKIVGTVLERDPTWLQLRPALRSAPSGSVNEIAFCPFGGDKIRDYPIPLWVEALRVGVPDSTPIRLLATPERDYEATALATELRAVGKKVIATIGISTREFIGHLATARLVVTSESAAAHIATALDQLAVILIGGGHFGWFGPWGTSVRQKWISKPLDCFGCNWVCTRPSVECVGEIRPDTITTAIQDLIAHA